MLTTINKHWSNLGFVISIMILVFVITSTKPIDSLHSLLWLHLAILMLHQFEEYSFPGKFKEFYNNHILNRNPITKHALSNSAILIVNVGLGWTFYLTSAIIGDHSLYLAGGLAAVTLLNGCLHSFMFLRLNKYNPGLISGFFIFIPFSLFLLYKISQLADLTNMIQGIMVFFIATMAIPLFIRLSSEKS